MKLKISTRNVAIFCLLLILIQVFYLLGFVGLRSIVSFGLFFFLPCYILLSFTGLPNYDKFFLSFSISLGIFSMVVFYLNRIIPSFRLTLIITLVVIFLLGFFKFGKGNFVKHFYEE